MADLQLCLAGVDHWASCMTKAEWSGWVQAVGSVGALLGIWYTVRKQRQLALEAERRAKLASVGAAVNNARSAVASVCAVLEQLNAPGRPDDRIVLRLHRSRIVEGLSMTQSVQLEHLPLGHQAGVLAMRHTAVMLRDCLDGVLEATTDRDRLDALRALSLIVADQARKAPDCEAAVAVAAATT